MKIYAITNHKGGSGKTTTAVNLAVALGACKHKTLVIDLDPQACASCWLGIQDGGRGLLKVFTDEKDLQDVICPTESRNVSIVPCSSWIFGIEKSLAAEMGAESILKRKLQKIPDGDWEYVLIDCPPNLGILTVNALTAADKVLIPVATQYLALKGIAQLMKILDVVTKRLNSKLSIRGVLPFRLDKRTKHSQDVVNELKKHFGSKVFKSAIHENVRLAEAPSFHKPIFQYDKNSTGAKDYQSLAREIIRIEKNEEDTNE